MAARVLGFLQDSGNPGDDEPTNCLMKMIARDSSPFVRSEALEALAVTQFSLPLVIERTKDISDEVRQTAFQVIASKVRMIFPISARSRTP